MLILAYMKRAWEKQSNGDVALVIKSGMFCCLNVRRVLRYLKIVKVVMMVVVVV